MAETLSTKSVVTVEQWNYEESTLHRRLYQSIQTPQVQVTLTEICLVDNSHSRKHLVQAENAPRLHTHVLLLDVQPFT